MAKKKNKKPMQIKETAEQRAERLAGFKPTTRIIPNKKKKAESRKVKHKKALLFA